MILTEQQKEERKAAQDVARGFLLGELMQSAMKQLRALDKPFLKLNEAEQKKVIRNVEDDLKPAVKRAVEIIATDDRTRFLASVEQVVFKDGVKAVLQMANTEASHELANTAGGSVLVVIEDPYRYLRAEGKPEATPDQGSLKV